MRRVVPHAHRNNPQRRLAVKSGRPLRSLHPGHRAVRPGRRARRVILLDVSPRKAGFERARNRQRPPAALVGRQPQTLREESARPSGIADRRDHTEICRLSNPRSLTPICLITATCCASFSPKKAASRLNDLNSFRTTVATPPKCPGPSIGRSAPRHLDVQGAGEAGSGTSGPRTADEDDVGAGPLASSASRVSCARIRSRSPDRRIAAGLTKRLTTTFSHSARARATGRDAVVQRAHRGHQPDHCGAASAPAPDARGRTSAIV